ncbi:IclR family transcriptional regulator [Citricoccus sp.]|uniref:IclR family transcriptional regulator n=1 Tax=Citricoccus sp. TaxID=1978372 RepID=UPI0028BE8564|nr:IclR family transcriptional regulator [Citricoccus sp.]
MANSRSGESLIQRLVRVLHAFDAEHPDLTASELALRTGLSTSTAHRLAGDMAEEGLLRRTPDGRFRIGLVLWELGQRSSTYQEFGQAALPFMEAVHVTQRQNTSLAILDHDDGTIIYLERLISQDVPTDLTKVAGRLPVLSTAPGLVILAHSPRHLQEEFLTSPWDRYTRDSGITEVGLRRRLAQARAEGYIHMRGVTVAGSSGTAAPVFGPDGKVLGAISIVARVDQVNLQIQVPALLAAARGLSRQMGSRGLSGPRGPSGRMI